MQKFKVGLNKYNLFEVEGDKFTVDPDDNLLRIFKDDECILVANKDTWEYIEKMPEVVS